MFLTIWACLGPFGPFQTKNDFLLKITSVSVRSRQLQWQCFNPHQKVFMSFNKYYDQQNCRVVLSHTLPQIWNTKIDNWSGCDCYFSKKSCIWQYEGYCRKFSTFVFAKLSNYLHIISRLSNIYKGTLPTRKYWLDPRGNIFARPPRQSLTPTMGEEKEFWN